MQYGLHAIHLSQMDSETVGISIFSVVSASWKRYSVSHFPLQIITQYIYIYPLTSVQEVAPTLRWSLPNQIQLRKVALTLGSSLAQIKLHTLFNPFEQDFSSSL